MNSILKIFLIATLFHFGCRTVNNSKLEKIKTKYEIGVNDSLQINLESNPSTGYSWKWKNKNSISIVDSVGFSFINYHPERVGSGGKEVWSFKAKKVGTETIKLVYNRSWDEKSTIDSIAIIVRVK